MLVIVSIHIYRKQWSFHDPNSLKTDRFYLKFYVLMYLDEYWRIFGFPRKALGHKKYPHPLNNLEKTEIKALSFGINTQYF